MFKKNNKYYFKLLLTVAIIAIPPFLFGNLFTAKTFLDEYIIDIDSRNIIEINHMGSLLEKNTNKIQTIAISSLSDNLLINPKYSGYGLSDIIKIKQLDRLSSICSLNEYIDSIYLYNSDEKEVLVSAYGILNEDDTRCEWIKEEIKKRQDEHELYLGSTREIMIPNNNRYIVPYIAKFGTVYGNNNYLLLNINIEKIFNDFIKEVYKSDASRKYFIVNAAGDLVFKSSYSDKNDAPSIETITSIIERNGTYSEDTYLYNSYFMKNAGWYLIMKNDISYVYAKVNLIKNRTIVYTCIILLGISLLVILGSKYLYKPIYNMLIATREKISFSEDDYTKSEFDFINNTIINMVTQATNLEDKLEKNYKLLRRTMLYNLLKGNYINYDNNIDVQRCLSDYETNFAVALIRIDQNVSKDECNIQEIINITQNVLLEEYQHDIIYDEDSEFIIAVLKTCNDTINEVINKIDKQKSKLKNLKSNIIISIGNIYSNDIGRLTNSYTEAIYAYNIGLINSQEDSILSYKHSASKACDNGKICDKDLNILKLTLVENDKENFERIIDKIIDRNLSVSQYSYNFYRIISIFINCSETDNLSFLEDINRIVMNGNLFNHSIVKNIFLKWFDYFSKEEEENKKAGMYMVKINKYIEDNYQINFSLDEVADYLGITKQYMCNILKNNYNITFVDYLNNYKIEKAKELINNDNFLVKDIYKLVGFSSSSYFIKVFKLYTGLTPGEYQKLLLKH